MDAAAHVGRLGEAIRFEANEMGEANMCAWQHSSITGDEHIDLRSH